MGVRLADTLEPLGDFPVAESKDVDIEINGTNKRLQQAYEDGDLGGGSTIQTDTLPIASAEEEDKIYQYTGEDGTYINGYFYQCVSYGYLGWEVDSSTVYTKDIDTTIGKKVYTENNGTFTEIGTINEVADDKSTMSYIDSNGDTFDCVRDNNFDIQNVGYTWIEKETSPSNVKVDNVSIVEDMNTHEISVSEDYETTKTVDTIDDWNNLSLAEKAKYKNVLVKNDETTTPISIVDMVQNGNMHAVTSNAVYDYVQTIKNVIPSNATLNNKLVSARDNNFAYNILENNTDLNTLVSTGTYTTHIDSGNESTCHAIKAGWHQVYVTNSFGNTSVVQQICILNDNTIYSRTSDSTSWTSWKKLAEEGDTVRWIGRAEGLTLAQIYNTYSKQNTTMYKGFLDWNDSRCPIYGQGADTVEITCYDWNLTAKSIRGQNYFYDDTNNVWVKNTNISQGTLTIPAQTIQSGEYAEVTVPLSTNEFYCGRLDFANLPSANMTISYNDFSGLFQDTKATQNRSQDVLIVVGKATQLTLHVYLINYTGQPVTIGNVDMTYYLEHHIVKE